MTEIVAASTPEDPALRFIRRELAPERWIATLACTGPAVIGVIAAVTFRIPYPVLFFAGPCCHDAAGTAAVSSGGRRDWCRTARRRFRGPAGHHHL